VRAFQKVSEAVKNRVAAVKVSQATAIHSLAVAF
jgi:hypothetical protein